MDEKKHVDVEKNALVVEERGADLKSTADEIRNLSTKYSIDSSKSKNEEGASSEPRKMNVAEALSTVDDGLKQLLEKDNFRNENEQNRVDLEERWLAVQEKQFERDADDRRTTTELLRTLVQNPAKH